MNISNTIHQKHNKRNRKYSNILINTKRRNQPKDRRLTTSYNKGQWWTQHDTTEIKKKTNKESFVTVKEL